MFGLTNIEGNHGEEVNENYFYLDSTPMSSYMKYLYKYPQREFPYRDLVETNGRRSREVGRSGGQPPNGLDGAHRTLDLFARLGPEDLLRKAQAVIAQMTRAGGGRAST